LRRFAARRGPSAVNKGLIILADDGICRRGFTAPKYLHAMFG